MAEAYAPALNRARVRTHVWALVAAHAGIPLAAPSFDATVSIPLEGVVSLGAIASCLGAIAVVTLFQAVRETLLPVRELEKGAPDPKVLLAAARAAIRAPRRIRWATLRHLGLSLVFCEIGWILFVPGFTGVQAVRVGISAACALAVGSFFAELTARACARKILEQIITAGLGPEEARGLQGEFLGSLRAVVIELVMVLAIVGSMLVSHAAMVRADGRPGASGWAIVLMTAVWAGAAAAVLAREISLPMREISSRAQRITAGRLERLPLVAGEQEVFVMAVSGARLERQLEDAVQKLAVASDRLSTTAAGLVGTLSGQEQGSAEQASALNETSATTEELARSAGQIAENASEVAAVAERTVQAAQAGQRGSEAFFNAMVGMRMQNQRVADAVIRLNKRVQQIGKIVEFIHELADKSDLLALNAELEGTKAGEVGRGFSLVAAEMRRVAEEVLRSTREIERLITDIRDATNAAVMATEAGVKATDGGTSAANEVMERLRVILEHAKETSDSVRSISMATQQQQSGSTQLAEAMADILRVTEDGAVATQQLHGANVDLSGLAESLRAVVSRFEVKGADAS